jgi:glycosyltransferase involved in cell wall biosynthesis
MTRPKLLVVGMPVYNGADYLSFALDSVLGQTYSDFRVVIGDNASTDETEEVCRRYAREDPRIEYLRHDRNLGGAPNFNSVLRFDAPYFKWVAHDDVLEPTYLEKCIGLLNDDPSLGLVHSLTFEIDAEGEAIGPTEIEFPLSGPRPHDRLWRLLWRRHVPEVWGVMRASLLQQTQGMGSYAASDRNLVGDLCLLGDVGYVDEFLFHRRAHAGSYMGGGSGTVDGKASRVRWYATDAKVPKTPIGLANLREYVRSVLSLPLTNRERAACLRVVFGWGFRRGIEQLTRRGDRYRETVASKRAGG